MKPFSEIQPKFYIKNLIGQRNLIRTRDQTKNYNLIKISN